MPTPNYLDKNLVMNDEMTHKTPRIIGVVIPAHNEEKDISACLEALKHAMDVLPTPIQVKVLVVLDNCEDETKLKVEQAGIDYLECNYRCVGRVRDIGIRQMIEQGVQWVACTDADTQVAPDWILQQLQHIKQQPTAMICGVVSIEHWGDLSPQTQQQYLAHYQDKMDHRHIHGANLSFSSEHYAAVGGFAAAACHEDVGLVKKFEQNNFPIVWSNQVRVITSSRLETRTAEGFANFLKTLDAKHRS